MSQVEVREKKEKLPTLAFGTGKISNSAGSPKLRLGLIPRLPLSALAFPLDESKNKKAV